MADVKRWVNEPAEAAAGATTVPAAGGTGAAAAPGRRRPFGLYVVIALLLVNAAGAFFEVLRAPVMVGGVLAAALGVEEVAVVNYAIAATLVVLAVGLWLLRRWAWVATMLMVGLGLAYGLVLYWLGTPIYWRMAAYMVAVLYLNQGAVQRPFGVRPAWRPARPVAAAEERA
jgi:hypothetical protein